MYRFLLLACALLVACGPGEMPRGDAGPDAGLTPDAGVRCSTAAECDDHLYCNGAERCDPGATGANAFGCVAGAAPCAQCDEVSDHCACDDPDQDDDGANAIACGGTDCDDADADRFPGNTEVCDASHDEDCDPDTHGTLDVDRDGHDDAMCCNAGGSCGDDCDDQRADAYPGLVEACDGRDNDCDDLTDEGLLSVFYRDADGDGYGTAADTVTACTPPAGYVALGTDCNDTNSGINPSNPEICNGLDDNCSLGLAWGGLDPSEDADGDGHSPPTAACALGFPRDDCNDSDPSMYPGAPELCDGVDQNCSSGGSRDPAEDADGDMHAPTTAACSGGFPRDDCNDADASRYPGAPELCDRADNDCSSGGGVDASEDADADGHAGLAAACSGGSLPKDDCDDTDAGVVPGSLAPPRLLGPENGALTGSLHASARGTLRPTFRWRRVDCGEATFELAVDDSCSSDFASCALPSPELTATAIAATSYRSATDLPVSTVRPVGRRYYWRVRACSGASCGAWSGVRYLDVGRVPSDFDGDGRSDVAAGASGYYRAFVFLGSASGVPTSPSISIVDPGAQVGSDFGRSLASAGDLNADGYADLVIGARFRDAPSTNEGNVFVYYGGPSGVPTAPSVTLDSPRGTDNGNFGANVSAAGDVNADGYADLVIDAPFDTVPIYVYHGGPSGIGTTPTSELGAGIGNTTRTSLSAAGDLNGDGFADVVYGNGDHILVGRAFVFYGSASGLPATASVSIFHPASESLSRFGSSVHGGVDFDGDGYADLAIGAAEQDLGASNEGNVYIYLGAAAGVGTAPVLTIDSPGNTAGGQFGYSVSRGGDVDGDGLGDLVASAAFTERAYVFPGSASGLPSAPTVTIVGATNTGFGQFVGPAGDVQGDGYDDIVIAAPGADIGTTFDNGRVLVFHGSASGIGTSASTTIDCPSFPGRSNLYFGWGIAR